MNKIALLNDAFRRTFAGGKVTMTAGVYALPDMVKATALQKAATFDAFTEDNDTYGEHDFGSFELCGRKFFWKIEYYDRDMQYGSEATLRACSVRDVLTVQKFLFDHLNAFRPADFHLLLPSFPWAGVLTTNYDLIIERVYTQARSPLQRLVPNVKDDDGATQRLDHKSLLYVKLHGCITRHHGAAGAAAHRNGVGLGQGGRFSVRRQSGRWRDQGPPETDRPRRPPQRPSLRAGRGLYSTATCVREQRCCSSCF